MKTIQSLIAEYKNEVDILQKSICSDAKSGWTPDTSIASRDTLIRVIKDLEALEADK